MDKIIVQTTQDNIPIVKIYSLSEKEKNLSKKDIKKLRFRKNWENNIKKLKEVLTTMEYTMVSLEFDKATIDEFKKRADFILRESYNKLQEKLKKYE